MNKKTRKALERSILKWRRIVNGTGYDAGASNCALCKIFRTNPLLPCEGCPVSEKTGRVFCYGTPYADFVGGRDCGGFLWAKSLKEQKHAQAMLDFLISLRPKTTALRKRKD